MENKKSKSIMDKDTDKLKQQALQDLPGAGVDAADDEKVNHGFVKQETEELNDNPRMDDGPDIFGK